MDTKTPLPATEYRLPDDEIIGGRRQKVVLPDWWNTDMSEWGVDSGRKTKRRSLPSVDPKYLDMPTMAAVVDIVSTRNKLTTADIQAICGKARSVVVECLNELLRNGVVFTSPTSFGRSKCWNYASGELPRHTEDVFGGAEINRFILDYLEKNGPKRRMELAQELNVSPRRISDCLSRLLKKRSIYIVRGTWKKETAGNQYAVMSEISKYPPGSPMTMIATIIATLQKEEWVGSREIAKMIRSSTKSVSDALCHLVRKGLAERRIVHSKTVPHIYSEYRWKGTKDE